MTLTLTLRTQPPARVAAGALIPERLQGLAASDVAALTVRAGRETLNVGDLFEVSGCGDDRVTFVGGLRRVSGTPKTQHSATASCRCTQASTSAQ